MFNFNKSNSSAQVAAVKFDKSTENNPPDLSTLNFPKMDVSAEKFNNSKVLPNYTKNPELELKQTLQLLKSENNLNNFKKDIPMIPQKPQPIPLAPNLPTIPPNILQNETQKLSQTPPIPIEASGMKKDLSPQMNCKFLNTPKCHPDFPHFSGASINFPEGAKMKCDSVSNEKPAKGVCTIAGGKITGVYLIDHGDGYTTTPKIEAIGGGGEGAKFSTTLDKGKIKDINVINGGQGYHETPVIKIESPNLSNGCYLCCK